MSHDNPSFFQKRTFQDSLPSMAILAFSNCMIGSTKGFDEFYIKNVSVVKESRLYKIEQIEEEEEEVEKKPEKKIEKE